MKAVDEVGEAPIHVACARGVLNIVLALAEKGADMNCASGAGVTPLHKAACFGQVAIVKYLIKEGIHTYMLEENRKYIHFDFQIHDYKFSTASIINTSINDNIHDNISL